VALEAEVTERTWQVLTRFHWVAPHREWAALHGLSIMLHEMIFLIDKNSLLWYLNAALNNASTCKGMP